MNGALIRMAEHIPDDEPVFVIRGRDSQSVSIMENILTEFRSQKHDKYVAKKIEELISDFKKWRDNNP